MRLKDIEARVVKLERDPRNTRLGRMTEDELNAEIIRLLNKLAADFPTYDAMIAHHMASADPFEQDVGKQMRTFLDNYLARHPQQPAA